MGTGLLQTIIEEEEEETTLVIGGEQMIVHEALIEIDIDGRDHRGMMGLDTDEVEVVVDMVVDMAEDGVMGMRL